MHTDTEYTYNRSLYTYMNSYW